MALLERSRVGGDCTWTDCVPSKALLRAAGVSQSIRHASAFGLPSYDSPVDLRAVMERVRSVIPHIYNTESPEALTHEGIDMIAGEAEFTGSAAVTVEG